MLNLFQHLIKILNRSRNKFGITDNYMKKELNIKFEKAVRFLVEFMPLSDESSRKPILFHDIRVGVYLYENNYSNEIVLAGILHDALEFSKITEEMLKENFSEKVLSLVKACTKDDSIEEPNEKTNELISRCANVGEGALIVKTADILDSFKFYSAEKNEEQLRYCMRNAEAILKYKPENFTDEIFDELKIWQNKFSD